MATICAGGVARQRCSRWTRISAREELPGLSTLRIWLTWSFCPPVDSVAGFWVGQPGRPRRRFASGSRLPGRWRPSPRSSGCSCGRCNATSVCSCVFMLICCSTPVSSERIRIARRRIRRGRIIRRVAVQQGRERRLRSPALRRREAARRGRPACWARQDWVGTRRPAQSSI